MRFVPELLAFTDGDVWRPGIGDPTMMGWLTVAAYFGTALLCFRNLFAVREGGRSRPEFLFWGTLAVLLVVLGFNKQLDLQTLLTLTARKIAVAQGWYEKRRVLQLIFLGCIVAAGAAGVAVMWQLVKRTGRQLWVPLLGFMLLLCFVTIRAASFHHVDTLINFRLAGVRMNWVLELGSIAVIAAGAWPARNRTAGPSGGGLEESRAVLQ